MNTLNLQPEFLYTSEEVSEYLHLSLRTVQRLLQSGALSSYKIHGQYRIKGLDLMRYLDGVRRDPNAFLTVEDGKPAQLLDELEVQPVTLALSLDLIQLVNPAQNPEFFEHLQQLRKRLSLELGFILPGVQFRDNDALKPQHYCVRIQGQTVVNAHLKDTEPKALLGIFEALVRRYAHEILSRDEVFVMIERLRTRHPVLVDEVLSLDGRLPGKLTIGQLTRVLRLLLAEQVSIRHLALILETVSDSLEQNLSPEALTEKVRQGLSRQICEPLADAEGVIQVVCLEPESEEQLRSAFSQADSRLMVLTRQLQLSLKEQSAKVLVCASDLRPRLRDVLERNFSHWQVLSYQEIDKLYRLELFNSLSLGAAS